METINISDTVRATLEIWGRRFLHERGYTNAGKLSPEEIAVEMMKIYKREHGGETGEPTPVGS